ncbi:MAG: OmpH family outer membrane protein [Candidatus Didemnitutus sp.]|nr:OmpH family outer membrane protein [Candidatus Didemnitutus sp.]
MNKILRTLLALAGLTAGVTLLHAQPAVKIVTVDMAKVYDTHFQTEEANVKFNEVAQRAREQLDQLNKDIQAAAEEFKGLVEEARSTLLTEQARAKAGADAQKKRDDIERMQNDGRRFESSTQQQLQSRAKIHRDLIMGEILKVVNDIAAARGATLVLDRSGPSVFGIPVILHSDPSYDITDEVMKEVNKDRPPVVAAPDAAKAAPVNPAAFSVPNVTAPKKN